MFQSTVIRKSNFFQLALCLLEIVTISVLICSCSFPLASSNGKYDISGVVKNVDGAPVKDAVIKIADTSIEATSDASGNYTLKNVPGRTVTLSATKEGYAFIADFSLLKTNSNGTSIDVLHANVNDIVAQANFIAVAPGKATVSMIQGKTAQSPLKDQKVYNVTGVITMITNQTAHAKYDTSMYDGTTVPQWVSFDGFYMEALEADVDGDPTTSDGIFIDTHDDAFTESKWVDGIPMDLAIGQVVSVTGTVHEDRPMDRFNSSTSYLTRTVIKADSVIHSNKSRFSNS